MTTTHLSLPLGITARLTSDTIPSFGDTAAFLAAAYVPDLRVRTRSVARPTFTIAHRESAERRLLRRGRTVTIGDRWNGAWPLDAYHLLYSVARVEFLRRHAYPAHAACAVLPSGMSALLVGHTGSGKTATLLRLIREHRARAYSGNKTLIEFRGDGPVAIAGTRTITARASDAEAHRALIARKESYADRCAFTLHDRHVAAAPRMRINSIALVRLDDGRTERTNLPWLTALHALYPLFLDMVNADTIVCDGAAVFTGTPPAGAAEHLTVSLRRALPHIPVVSVVGPSAFVAKEIARL